VAVLAVVLGLVTIAAALRIYESYSGEQPVADLLYDLRLRRADLQALDRRSAANPARSDLVVSLTTLPSRIERLDLTLKSLLRQRVSPAAIRVNVPAFSRREGRPYVVPERFRRLESVTFVTTEDLPCSPQPPTGPFSSWTMTACISRTWSAR
jgi:hypothetical protein